jgi:hypothetical protein
MTLLPSLLIWVNAASLPADLPQDVRLKTQTESFSSENLYALRDGKLWVKPNPRAPGAGGEWVPFEGTGVPFGKKAPSFGAEDRLTGFAAEGLMVVALSEKGRVYVWQPTLFEPTVWMDRVGQPIAGPLRLPPHKDFTFSLSVQVAPKKRRTPMHDIDAFYEDAAGNRVEFGFTATVYVLDPDGQRIRYWDTGLPPAFYRAFATPDRGRFVAERLVASGSTVLVVDKAGRLATRMMDYEMNGACPGLRYTFEKKKQGEQILSLFAAERVLPLEGWRMQPSIPLEGQAERTTLISIHMTGQGNAARELRVRGRNAAGVYGYWWKPVFELTWQFETTGETYDAAAVVPPGAAPVLGPAQDRTYAGKLTRRGSPPLDVELLDFDYYDSPATLRLHQGGRSWDVRFHTFDAWGPTVQQKEHPDLVGSALGEPKLLLGTLEVPPELLTSSDAPTRALVGTYLRRFHQVHQAFTVAADDGRVELRTRLVQREGTGAFQYAVRWPVELDLTRELSADELARYEATNFTHLAQSAELLLPPESSLTGTDAERVAQATQRNRALLTEIERQERQEKVEHLEGGTVSALASAVFVPVNLLSDALGLPKRVQLAGGLSMTGGTVFKEYAWMNLRHVISSPDDTRRAEALLRARIRDYERMERKLRKT